MDFKYSGFFGLLLLIADVWAIVQVLGSRESSGTKVIWVVLILILPLLGFVLWFFMGPRNKA